MYIIRIIYKNQNIKEFYYYKYQDAITHVKLLVNNYSKLYKTIIFSYLESKKEIIIFQI